MSSSRTKRRLKSGNHGSDSSEQSAAPVVQGTFSTAPRQSAQAFVPPVTVPVKKLPKINDLVKDPEPLKEQVVTMSEKEPRSVEKSEEIPSVKVTTNTISVDDKPEKIASEKTAWEDTSSNGSLPEENETAVSKNSASDEVDTLETAALAEISESEVSIADDRFVEAWNTMFELLFREIATIYYPLKEFVPPIKDNVIYVKVKNDMMKESFESRIRLALEFLRKNYDPKIDDIVVEVDAGEQITAKLIYDTQDKMNDLYKENHDLPEFLKILNLSAKDM